MPRNFQPPTLRIPEEKPFMGCDAVSSCSMCKTHCVYTYCKKLIYFTAGVAVIAEMEGGSQLSRIHSGKPFMGHRRAPFILRMKTQMCKKWSQQKISCQTILYIYIHHNVMYFNTNTKIYKPLSAIISMHCQMCRCEKSFF